MNYDEIASTAVADVQETFKRVYLEAVDAVPDATALTAQMRRTRKFRAGPDGLYFNAKLETGGAVANVPDGKLLPTASRPQRKTGKVGLSHTYTVIAVGGQSIPLTDNNRDAFVSNLQDQMDDAMIRVKNDVERQYNGDTQGILCVVETVAGAPTYGAQNPYGVANGGLGCMLLIEGMEVAIINPSGGAERGRATIASVDQDAETFTLDGSVAGTTIGDYVVLCNTVTATGTDKATNYQAESNGILAVTQSGDQFENIDGATYRRWNGVRETNGGTLRDVTEKLIATLRAKTRAKSGKAPTLYYTTPGISIIMQDQLAGLRRFTGETVKLRGGYEGLQIGNKTVIEGDWCAKGHLFALNFESEVAGMVDLVPMGFVDLDGAKLHRAEGRHAYRADLWFPHQAIWFQRAAQGVITDLNDDTSITR